MQKNMTKGSFAPRHKTSSSPVVATTSTTPSARNNRNSPVRVAATRDRVPGQNVNVIGQRPRSGNKKHRNPPEHDEFLSQSDRYASEYDSESDAGKLLQGSDLDSLKDFVQSQQLDFEADQAKGRKSSSNNLRGSTPTNFRTKINAGGKVLQTSLSQSRDFDTSSDQNSEITEVVDYINSPGRQSDAKEDRIKTEMIMRLASQMDHNEIDKAIALLQQFKMLAVASDASASSSTPHISSSSVKRSAIYQQSQQTMRRSKSGPPGTCSNRPYLYSSSAGSGQVPLRSDHQAVFNDDHSDNEQDEPEVVSHNDYNEKYVFIPPALTSNNFYHHQQRSDSEISHTSNNGSRASTPNPNMMSHKRSPTPVSVRTEFDGKHDLCPAVERDELTINIVKAKQNPKAFNDVAPASGLCIKAAFQACNVPGGVTSPRSLANDDGVSVGSSHSSFTAVSSTGGHSVSKNR